MDAKNWLLGSLLWDVASYLNHVQHISPFLELYKNVPALQPVPDTEWQNRAGPHGALREARSLALGYNWQPAGINYIPKALKSIFASIQLRPLRNTDEQPKARYLCLQPLHEEPKRQETGSLEDKNLEAYLLRFISELKALNEKWNSHDKLDTLLPLLEKYFWCLPPWNVSEETDVPLFALAKMSTAIMACWPANDKGQPQVPLHNIEAYTLICGDISGIQKYIYRISSAKGVAKGLKARSFELAILSDAVAKWLLRRFKLTNANLIYSSGGKFYLLAPATAKNEIAAEGENSINLTLAQKFWDAYGGELFLGLGAVSLSGQDFMAEKFGGKWEAVTKACGKPKQTKFHLLLAKKYTEIFDPQGVGAEKKTCSVCGREESEKHPLTPRDVDPATKEAQRRLCDACLNNEELGSQLARVNLIAEVETDNAVDLKGAASLTPLNLGLTYYLLNESDDCKLFGESVTYWNLNIHNYVEGNFKMRDLKNAQVDCGFRFYGGNEIPAKDSGEPMDYNDLAEASQGIKRLGILRMDVDSLSEIFRDGLTPRNTAARVLTLSWHLNYYFCGRLNTLREQTAAAESLIVYSGGDDLFIVGAWNKVLDLALKIRRDFAEYTQGDFKQHKENPQFTISGGLMLAAKKFPIHKAALICEQAEDEAKEIDGVIRRSIQAQNLQHSTETAALTKIKSRKNGFTFLEKPLRWQDFDIVASIKDALYQAITAADPPLNKGILSRLRQIYALFEARRRELKEMSRQNQTAMSQHLDLLMYDKWRWRLVYTLKRYKDDNNKHEKLIDHLQKALIDNEWQPLIWENGKWHEKDEWLESSADVQIVSFIDVPTRWVELLTREEKES